MSMLGLANRLFRLFGWGRPLYRVEGLRIRYQGEDKHDLAMFRQMIDRELPYGFTYGSEEKPDDREESFREWINTYCIGRNWHQFNPVFGNGEVRFADNADALAFRVTFNDLHDLKHVEVSPV